MGAIADLSRRPSRSDGGGCGLTIGRLGSGLDPVVKCHTENEFWQLGSVEPSPAFLCALEQFEDHCERGPVGQTAVRSDRAVAHGDEGAYDFPQPLAVVENTEKAHAASSTPIPTVRFNHPASQIVLQDYIHAVTDAEA
jgi:hypothetical protein